MKFNYIVAASLSLLLIPVSSLAAPLKTVVPAAKKAPVAVVKKPVKKIPAKVVAKPVAKPAAKPTVKSAVKPKPAPVKVAPGATSEPTKEYNAAMDRAQTVYLKARKNAKGNKAKLDAAEVAYTKAIDEADKLLKPL